MFFLFFIFCASIDLKNAIVIDVPDNTVDKQINGQELTYKVYLIRGFNSTLLITGSSVSCQGMYVEGTVNITFFAQTTCTYNFEDLMTNASLSFIGDVKELVVKNTLRVHEDSLPRIFELTASKANKPNSYEIVFSDQIIAIFLQQYQINFVSKERGRQLSIPSSATFDNYMHLTAILKCNTPNNPLTFTPRIVLKGEIFAVPNIKFVGEGDGYVTLPNGWATTQINPKVRSVISNNDFPNNRLFISYETAEEIGKNIFTFTAPNVTKLTNVYKGHYIMEGNSSIDHTGAEGQTFNADPASKIYHAFVPYNDEVHLTAVGYTSSNKNMMLSGVNNTNLIIAGWKELNYVSIEESSLKSIHLTKVQLEARATQVSEEIEIPSESSIYFIGDYTLNAKTINAVGGLYLYGVNLNTEYLFIHRKYFTSAFIKLLTSNTEKRHLDIDFEKGQCNINTIEFSDDSFIVEFDDQETMEIPYSKFTEITFHLQDFIQNYQVRMIFTGRNKQEIRNKFNFNIESENTPIFLVGYSFYAKQPQISITVNSEKKYFVKTENDFSPDGIISFKDAEIITDTKGKYCVIESGSSFEKCSITEERIVYKSGTSITHRFSYVDFGVSKINIKVTTDCTFSSKSLENISAMIYGNHSLVTIYQNSPTHDLSFVSVDVSFIAPTGINCRGISLCDVQHVNWGTQSITLHDLLLADVQVLKGILQFLQEGDTLRVVGLLNGDETRADLYLDKVALTTSSGTIEFPWNCMNKLHFKFSSNGKTKENPFLININIPEFSFIPKVLDVISNDQDVYVKFPTYTGNEYYQSPSKGVFYSTGATPTKWHILSDISVIPVEVFKFPESTILETMEHGAVCFYHKGTNPNKCPITHKQIEFDDTDKKFTKEMIGDFKVYDFIISGSKKEHPLFIDISLFSDKVVWLSGLDNNQYVKLPAGNFNNVKLKDLIVSVESNELVFSDLTIIRSEIEGNWTLTAPRIITNLQVFKKLKPRIKNKAKIFLYSDDTRAIKFSKDGFSFNNVDVDASKYEAVTMIYTTPIYSFNPLQISFSGNEGDKLVYLPLFKFLCSGNIFVHFTDAWKGAGVTSSNKIEISPQGNSKTIISSDYLSYPENIFLFKNPMFSNKDIAKYCLVSSDIQREVCPEWYKIINYSNEITKEMFNESESAQGSEFLIIGSSPEKYPILPDKILGHSQVTFRTQYGKVGYIEASLPVIDSLTLVNTHLFAKNEETTIVMRKLEVVDNTSTIEGTAVLNPASVFMMAPNEEIMNHLSKSDERILDISFVSSGNVSTIRFEDEKINVCYNKTVLGSINQTLFVSATIRVNAEKLFLDYSGSASIRFAPQIVFKENEEPSIVTFSDRWSSVTSLEEKAAQEHKKSWIDTMTQKGSFSKPPSNEINFISEYSNVPSCIFKLPERSTVTYPTPGKYCIYSETVSYSWSKCPSDSIMISTKPDSIVQSSTLSPDQSNYLQLYCAADFAITGAILSFKSSIAAINNERRTVRIVGDNQASGGGQLSLSHIQCELDFSSGGFFVDKLALVDSTVKKVSQSYSLLAKRVEGSIKDVSVSQAALSSSSDGSAVVSLHSEQEINVKIILGESKLIIGDEGLRYSQLGHITLSLKNVRAEITAELTVQDVISINTKGNVNLTFLEPIYAALTTETGVIQRESGNLYMYSKYVSHPQIFIIPKESEHVFYNFGPKASPFPTAAPSQSQFPPMTPRRTYDPNYIEYINASSGVFGLSRARSALAISITFVVSIIIGLVIFLIFRWKRYTRFNVNNDLHTTSTGILGSLY